MWRTLACMLLAGVPVLAQVQVRPREVTLAPGQTCAFEARLAAAPMDRAGERDGLQWRWTVEGGGGDVADGWFIAHPAVQSRRVRVRATLAACPDLWEEAVVTVLAAEVPVGLVGLLGQVLGPDWVTPYTESLPFVDVATGRRFPHAGAVDAWPFRPGLPPVEVGYGLPLRLAWTAAPPGAEATLLSCWLDCELARRDVTGLDAITLTLRAWPEDFQVESLQRRPEGGWISTIQRGEIQLRGLVPVVGNPLVQPALADGRGLSARFREPYGMLVLGPGRILVADAGGHVLRTVDGEGRVVTLCGDPDRPGCRDTPDPGGCLRRLGSRLFGQEATVRFNRPTFLASDDCWGRPGRALVADSGNHAIRAVQQDGTTSTLAGGPGEPGHLDGQGTAARFRRPLGLAMHAASRILYVADQGNAVIRSLAQDGTVATVAGEPGRPGDQDGPAGAARFTDVKGLALASRWRGRPTLYILDGHAVRALDLGTGGVTTVLGRVSGPGFREVRPGGDLLAPCLNDPWDLRPSPVGFLIVDRGNHAVREWDVRRGTLATVAGDPGHRETRWGLLRDGMDVPLDASYAALDGPRALLDVSRSSCLVATGSALACLGRGDPDQDQAWTVQLACTLEAPAGACRAMFSMDRAGPGDPLPLRWTAEFLDPGGALAERRSGDGFTGSPICADGVFGQSGTGSVVVRCVTHQGRSAGARESVVVP